MASSIYLTYIDKEGPFLKVWGQTERNSSVHIEKNLQQMLPQFEQGLFAPSPGSIQVGVLCCAKYKDGLFYRARITNIVNQNIIEVHFIDYGNKDAIPVTSIRLMTNFPSPLISIPPQAREFVLAGIMHRGQIWDEQVLAVINSEIRYIELQWGPIGTVGNYTLIKLFKNGEDISHDFIARGLVSSVTLPSQQQILHNFSSTIPNLHSPVRNMGVLQLMSGVPSNQTPVQPTLLTYKLFSLEVGSVHDVYVSYVSDGPCHFSLQLQKLEDTLTRLMKEINRMPLQPLEDDPLPGTVCVARCTEDNHICRAVVTSVVDNMYKVFYVDFGNTELLSIDSLYQVPFKFVIPKVMAMRYALAGLDRSSVTLEMKCAFKEFVKEKLLHMRVLPAPARSALPLCELWDDNNINVLDVIRKAALVAYPEPIQLTRGFSQEVHVSYVYSCSRFYVQLKSKEEDLRRVMAELQVNCPHKPQLCIDQINIGQPCCALFESDGLWYRAQVLNVDDNQIRVIYVDYGNEEVVSLENLRIPQGELLTVLRPQALECCLNGYQKMETDLERDSFLEELILEKDFTMKVVEMQGKRALIELMDVSRYNVASLLLDKIASAHSQASPLLIQDGNRVEQRKRSSPTIARDQGYSKDEQPSHKFFTKKQFGDKDKSGSWRQKVDDKRLNHGDNRCNISFDDKNDWRQRKSAFRDSPKNDKWGDTESFERNKLHRSKESNNSNNNWNNQDKGHRDKWKKKEKETKSGKSKGISGSDKSFSDTSEKNWRSRPQVNFRNKGKSNSDNKKGSNKEATLNSQIKQLPREEKTVKPLDLAPANASFKFLNLQDTTEVISICWFYNPTNFFCQLQNCKEEFKKMMEDIQESYQNRYPSSIDLSISSPVIALFPEDGVVYRAQIIESIGSQWKVQYVDFGNVAITEKIWPIERKFMEMPAQAICCGLALLPVEKTWPEPDAFSSYFNKEHYSCNFTGFNQGKYVVELYDNCENISELLISASLAKSPEKDVEVFKVKYSTDTDLCLLFNQQIRVTLSAVNTVQDFFIILPNGQEVNCCLCNSFTAEKTWNDTLKQVVGYTVIVHVTSTSDDNKLEVVIYDTTGNKLKLVEPDEGTLEWISFLCPMPVFNSTIACWVSHFTESSIFIQPSDFGDTITQLLDSMFHSYDNTVPDESLQIQEGFILAVHSDDGNWYRGQVTAIEDDKITVIYVDYGNSESVSQSEVRELAFEHSELHMLALKICLTEPLQKLPENEVYAKVWYGDCGWEGKIISSLSSDEQEEHQYEGVPVLLSHSDSPGEFYLQLLTALDQIESLQNILQEQISLLQDLENPTAGILCAAQYSVDGIWYRCQILDADADITSVRFIDYGNTDVLDNKTTKLKMLPPDLLTLEQYAQRCSLCIQPIEDEEWTQASLNRFDQLVKTENLMMKIIHQNEKSTYVELYSGGEKVSEKLLMEGLVRELVLETDSSSTGYVSHLNSPSEFWIQLENSVGDLEWIAEQLSTAENFAELEDIAPGSLCAALFPEDEMWYRARILSNTVAGLEVIFIDYGNSCTCSGLRQLPEDLILLPPLAIKCSLNKPVGTLQWSPQATEKFRELSADGATIFNVHKITADETSIVDLFLDNQSITEKLLPETAEGFISHFESVEEFWIQKAEDVPKLDYIIETMANALNWEVFNKKTEENTELVAAQFPEDQVWYRAEILEIKQFENEVVYVVRFIDYGNICETAHIRQLDERISETAPLAIKCRLELLPGHRWSDESSEKLSILVNGGKTTFQIEFVTNGMVRLYLDGKDIRTELNCAPLGSLISSPKRLVVGECLAKDIINDICSEVMKILDHPQETILEMSTINDHLQSETSDLPKNENISEIQIPNEKVQFDESHILEDRETNNMITENNILHNNETAEVVSSILNNIIDEDVLNKKMLISENTMNHISLKTENEISKTFTEKDILYMENETNKETSKEKIEEYLQSIPSSPTDNEIKKVEQEVLILLNGRNENNTYQKENNAIEHTTKIQSTTEIKSDQLERTDVIGVPPDNNIDKKSVLSEESNDSDRLDKNSHSKSEVTAEKEIIDTIHEVNVNLEKK
ncbi:maternal protein tudor-like isoform X2 [Agrilus planipennis]|uniref:Maternal protein tudor-like isoform X2 n=1 Tax=Agrilus planipennis TaxID=224129 RepID=A0A7F5RHI5_AGRPL|nr:maternal protein tudor-like isoform X2 [Agrilus planipennis]